MKTRTNQPLEIIVVKNIEQLTDAQCDELQCGDIIVKQTGEQKHAYKVAYKKDDEMALVYCDYHNVEEVYYEKNSTGWHWVSTEINPIDKYQNVEEAQSGTIVSALGLDSNGKLVKETISGSEVVAYEGVSLLPTDVVFEDWTLHRAIKDGDILWVVFSGVIVNNGSETIGGGELPIFSLSLPTDILSKIYRVDGTTCNNNYNSSSAVLYDNGYESGSRQTVYIRSQQANELKVIVNSSGNFTSGSTRIWNVRIPIFLDIGTVE